MKLKKWISKTAVCMTACILLTAGCTETARTPNPSDGTPTPSKDMPDPQNISASLSGSNAEETSRATSQTGTLTAIPSENTPTLSGFPEMTQNPPAPTASAAPTPTQKPDSYLTPLPDGGYSVSEEIIKDLSYTSNSYPRLFARYQGQLGGSNYTYKEPEYMIDIIELDVLGQDMVLRIQIDFFHVFETLRQTFTIPFQDGCWDLHDGLWITDLNGDGMNDFIVDLGTPLARISDRALFFVYDQENNCYKNLGWFYDATFHEEEGVIYEFHYTEADHWKPDLKTSIVRNKYIVKGSSLVLLESLTETFPYLSEFSRREPFPSFTLRQNIDGELKTIYSNVSAEKIDFSVWPERDRNRRVK